MVRKIATETLNALGFPDVELSISLVSDARIMKLNRDYLHRDRATDVLAFSMNEGDFGEVNPDLLGDVVISVETTRRQAERQGHSFNEELCLLLAHGILHLLGYDHEQGGAAARRMRKKERAIMEIVRNKGW